MKKILLVMFIFIYAVTGHTQTASIKGIVFGDYFYNLKNHSAINEDENGFLLRRIYFTFENQLTDNIKMRFRLDTKHEDYGEKEKLYPFVKHAYLEIKNIIPHHKFYLGISATNAIDNTQSYWGYRPIEKTIMNLNKISDSADMGLSLKGDINQYIHHWITVFNGTGYGSSEVDKYKKLGYSLWITPIEGMILEGYIDYEKQDPETGTYAPAADYFHSSGYRTLKGFAGYRNSNFTLGGVIFSRVNYKSGSSDSEGTKKCDVTKTGISVFGNMTIVASKLKAFARYDYFDPNTDDHVYIDPAMNGKDDEETLVLAGLDLTVANTLHLMPNIIIKGYRNNNIDQDITARITFSYKYDTGSF